MKNTKIAEKEFDEWAEAAESNPASFEEMRLAAIEAFIASVPEENQDRLRKLQWRIDQERRLAKTPMNACIRLSRMMWRNVLGHGGLRDRFDELNGLLHGEAVAFDETEATRPAQVLAFARD